MIADMIGLQVAATLVPLDVSAPVERTMQMLLDLKSRTVITDRDLAVEVQTMNTTASANSFQPGFSESKWETRVSNAACHRLFAHCRLTDLTNGLVAGRIPDEHDHCVVGRYGMFSEEALASELPRMSIHHTGDVLLEEDVASAAVPLFQSLFQANSDVNFVIHSHKSDGGAINLGREFYLLAPPD